MEGKKFKTRGSALLSALFIMTMVAIAATAMGTRLQLDIYRTRLSILSDKLYLASEGVIFWSMDQLRNNKRFISNHYGQILKFPSNLAHMYPEVTLSGAVYDMQARFNLNNLTEKAYKPLFLKLLEQRLPKLSPAQRLVIFEATQAWISNYQPGKGQEKWMNIYAKAKPPYLPSCQPMQSVSEFRLIYGITAENFNLLVPFISVLPEVTPLNINTMPVPLLGILAKRANASQAADIARARGAHGFKNMAEASRVLGKLEIPTDLITVDSKYYLTTAYVNLEDLNLIVYVLLKRTPNQTTGEPGSQFQVSIINESYNSL
jgi:general secretion pathway protein K